MHKCKDPTLNKIDRILAGETVQPTVRDDIQIGSYFRQSHEILESFAVGRIGLEEYLTKKTVSEKSVLKHIDLFNTSEDLERRAKLEPKWDDTLTKKVIAHEKAHAKVAAKYALNTLWGFYHGDGINPPCAFSYHANFVDVARKEKWGRKKILEVLSDICNITDMGEDDRQMKEIADYGLSLIHLGKIPE
ncbi:hypothetical protein HOD83_01865 [Candidatus Woesearchaeota archaeon]|jgi:hypothetical protein|nr:hypothetical protein [Candidatus Woesearchaeota archaeon]MBT4114105.1 hypothetical protein [Candidatus Woesearchaeota archaeon]MBT4248312.1 hypothetical protein [Candidatus Woesearchaeota archaeon]